MANAPKVRISVRTKILAPVTLFLLAVVAALSASAWRAREAATKQADARVESVAEIFGEWFATSVLAGEEANWAQLDQVIESIRQEDRERFFAFIVVQGREGEHVGAFDRDRLPADWQVDAASVDLLRRAFRNAQDAVASYRGGDDLALTALRADSQAKFAALGQKRRALLGRILADPHVPGVRVYRTLIHDCRPATCPAEPALDSYPVQATVLVGVHWAPIAAARQQELALLLTVTILAVLVGAGGAWWIASFVSRPVKSLVAAIGDVDRGVYGRVEVESRDEIGLLARTFNSMVAGLAEKETLRRERERLKADIETKDRATRELVEKKKRVEDALVGLASMQVSRRFLEGKATLDFKGETREATILFADVRGFTAMCERLGVDEVFGMLNGYFTRVAPVIDRWGGCIMKFMGDALMVSWNVPEPQEHHALRAVYAGIDLQRELIKLNREREAEGKEPIRVGIGVNTGPVMVGNVGSASRFDFTVIGDAVNTAQRIESITPEKHLHISETTWAAVEGFVEVVAREPVLLKGKENPVQIYAVVRRTKKPSPVAPADGDRTTTTTGGGEVPT